MIFGIWCVYTTAFQRPELAFRLAGWTKGDAMTILMSISLLSIGASIGFLIASVFSSTDESVGAVVSPDDLKPTPTEDVNWALG